MLALTLIISESFAQQPGPWEIRNKKLTRIWNLSDEFNSFNWGKWNKSSPYNFFGRKPSRFKGEASWIKNGNLVLGAEYMDPKKNGGNYIKAGYVRSKWANFKPGYYCEVRMKASNLRMGSDFWFVRQFNKGEIAGNPFWNRINLEVDVTEGIGGGNSENARMKSNVHCFRRTDRWKKNGNKAYPQNFWAGNIRQYHTYGFYYENSNSLKFYLDGKWKRTVNPECAFKSGMHIIFSHEVYDWLTPPAQWQVKQKNDAKRMFVDYVRTWKVGKKKNTRYGEDDYAEVEEPTVLSLETYPNPVEGNELNLDVTIPTSDDLQLQVYNSSGRQVFSKSYPQLEEGVHTLTFDLDALNIHEKGIYLVKVSSGSSNVLKKVIY